MVLDGRGGGEGGVFNFFAEIINHLPIRSISRVANLQSFIISPVFSTVYVFSSNFFRYIDEVSESFFDFWK